MSISCTIAGTAVDRLISISRPDVIDQKTVCTLVVVNDSGTAVYQRGQPVVVTDSILGTIFTGFLNNPTYVLLYPNAAKEWTIDCVQTGDYLAGKRTSNITYENQYAGVAAVDQIQRYGATEGLSANAVLRWDETSTDWTDGYLSDAVVANNVPDGNPGAADVELAPAGTEVDLSIEPATFTNSTLDGCEVINAEVITSGGHFSYVRGQIAPLHTSAIKITGTQSVPQNNGGNSYAYVQILKPSSLTLSGNGISYDIWIDPSSPECKIAPDIVFTDGTNWRTLATLYDQQNLPPHPGTDLKGVASGTWYHRRFYLNNNPINGKTIKYISFAIEGDSAGTYTGWLKNVSLIDSAGNFKQALYDGTPGQLQVQSMQMTGYSNVSVEEVDTVDLLPYDTTTVGKGVSASETQAWKQYPMAAWNTSVDAVKLLKSSYISWKGTDTANTKAVISYWLDGWGNIECQNNAALPDFPAGLALAGRTITVDVQFCTTSDSVSPEEIPNLAELQLSLLPSYVASKIDTSLTCADGYDWAAKGTATNTMPAWLLNDYRYLSARSWASTTDDVSGLDLFSSDSGSGFAATTTGLSVTCGASTDARVRWTNGPILQNGFFSVSINVNANIAAGVVWRTTAWQSANNSFAYGALITTTNLQVGHGTNNASGAGTWTQLSSQTISLTAGFHTLSVYYFGANIIVSIDGGAYLASLRDTTYTGPGYMGLRVFNGTTSAAAITFNSLQTALPKALSLQGAMRTWDDGLANLQTLYTATTSAVGTTVNNKSYQIATTATDEARSRLDFAGYYSDFVLDVDIQLVTNSEAGIVYRTTGWSTADSNYAYAAEITLTSFALQRGSNSSSSSAGTRTQVGSTVTLALTSGDWHHFQFVIAGSTHTVIMDGIQIFSQTDSTYTSAGQVGLRSTVSAAVTQLFDNFGIVSALSGTWQSSAIDVSGLTTYGNSLISWRELGNSNTTILVQASIDGGTTWQTCTSGQAVPNFTDGQSLAGVSLLVKVTLSTTIASDIPSIDNLNVQILGLFNADGFRWSNAIDLSSITEAGDSVISWNATVPANTSLTVGVSNDGGTSYTTVASGDHLPAIAIRQPPEEDTFSTNTSADYTSTAQTGGAAATWAWDTTNSRVIATGGTNALLLSSAVASTTDSTLQFDLDEADNAGAVLHYADSNSSYYCLIHDASSATTPNTATLYKWSYGTGYTLGTVNSPIHFVRGALHRFVFQMVGTVLTLSMDGVQISTYDDAGSSPIASGKCGLVASGGTNRFYNFRIQQLGDNLAGKQIYTQVELFSEDPTTTPMLYNMQTFASSPDVNAGLLLDSVQYQRTFISDNISDLSKKSNFWTSFDGKKLLFQNRQASPAPFVISSLNSQILAGQSISDILLSSAEIDTSGDAYRNRQVMQNAIATDTYTETFHGDGSTTSWSLSYPLAAAPTILLNGRPATCGIKNSDTGKQFYYQIGETGIDQDSAETVLAGIDVLTITYSGTSTQDVVVDNTSLPGTITQSMMQAIEQVAGGTSSGIVEAVEDLSSTPTSVADATALATQRLQRYGMIGRTFKFKTLRSGLTRGMEIALFVPEFGLWNVHMLVTEVDVDAAVSPAVPGDILYTWSVTAMEGPNLGTWVQLFLNAFQ